MSKKVLFIMMILFCLSFAHTPVYGSDKKIDEIVLNIGEQHIIDDYAGISAIWGDAASLKNGILTGYAKGSSLCIYIGRDGDSHIVIVRVKNPMIMVTMLDVGQGEAFLIKVNGRTIILDTGEKNSYVYLKKQLDYYMVQNIDLLIISHMDTDHMGAAQLLMQDYKTEKVMMPGTPGNSTEYFKLMNYIEKKHIETVYVQNNDIFEICSNCNIEILGTDLGEGTNDSSIVMKLSYIDNSFLFTGDASATVLNKILEEGKDVSADVLKIPHHGSDSSSPILFLKNVGAQYSLISTGRDNAYGHPTDNVIRRLETLNSKVFRTDLDGTVTITGDGKTLEYSCEKIIDWEAEEKLKVEDGCIIGNIRSKVYHNPDCISLPLEKNRIYYYSAHDAEEAGYRKCSICVK